MFANSTSKLAATVALNILADALNDRPQSRPAAQPMAVPGNTPLGFVEYSRTEIVNKPDDLAQPRKVREAIATVERALPFSGDMNLSVLKQLLREIIDNAHKSHWTAVALCTGVMCTPGQTRDCVKVVYVLDDGSSRSATWFKQ